MNSSPKIAATAPTSSVPTISELPTETFISELKNYRLFRVTGLDATRYLHGRLTQDIKALQHGQSVKSLLLSPQGRILGKCLVLKHTDQFILLTDPLPSIEEAEKFRLDMLQFKVSDQVEVTEDQTFMLFAMFGLHCEKILQALCPTLPNEKLHFVDEPSLSGHVIRYHLGAVPGFWLVLSTNKTQEVLENLQAKIVTDNGDAYELFRILSVSPLFGVDLNEKVLAPEIAPDELVSFQKGCYVGQEVVEMVIARGRPNKILRLLVADLSTTAKVPCAGNELFISNTQQGIGHITSVCQVPTTGACYVLAFLKTSFEATECITEEGATFKVLDPTLR